MKILAALAILAVPLEAAVACSLSGSKEFRVSKPLKEAKVRWSVRVKPTNFIPSMGGGFSCDGAGSLSVTLEGVGIGRAQLREFGYFIRAISGVTKDLFPEHALAAVAWKSEPVLTWGWYWATPTEGKEYHWVLELVPVSKDGVLMQGIPFCVSSDNWCDSWRPEGSVPAVRSN
jgi:hypothetical protein